MKPWERVRFAKRGEPSFEKWSERSHEGSCGSGFAPVREVEDR